MRNEVFVDKIGRPIKNNVIVEVIDTFDGFKSKGGIDLINATDNDAWGDSDGFNITEFIVRYGTVVRTPNIISSGTFDYETELEIKEGDVVYWNSISFKEHIPLVVGDKKYLLVDYHEIVLRIRNEEITPINGFCLLLPVQKEIKFLAYSYNTVKSEEWILYKKPEKMVKELNPRYEFTDMWHEGETVMISIIDKPYQLEGWINKIMDKQLYACPLRFIMVGFGVRD